MAYYCVRIMAVLVLSLATGSFSLPYRAFSARSVPGRIRASASPDLSNFYLSRYLNNPRPYALPEYQPTYQQGYLSRRPHINPETIAALLPYISQTEMGDYSYDYNGEPTNSFTDDEGTWYDDAEYFPARDSRDKNNEQAALYQLYIDNLAGKYSLEDLETLEREAAMEDNTENQLQALVPEKRSYLPFDVQVKVPERNVNRYPIFRQGQKEESVNVPASSVRKPMFTRSPIANQKQHRSHLTKVASTSSTVLNKEIRAEDSSNKNKDNKDGAKLYPSSTEMEPSIKSAYDAFHKYLEQERALRQTRDDATQLYHKQQKRFVIDPNVLTQQLANLKKNLT